MNAERPTSSSTPRPDPVEQHDPSESFVDVVRRVSASRRSATTTGRRRPQPDGDAPVPPAGGTGTTSPDAAANSPDAAATSPDAAAIPPARTASADAIPQARRTDATPAARTSDAAPQRRTTDGAAILQARTTDAAVIPQARTTDTAAIPPARTLGPTFDRWDDSDRHPAAAGPDSAAALPAAATAEPEAATAGPPAATAWPHAATSDDRDRRGTATTPTPPDAPARPDTPADPPRPRRSRRDRRRRGGLIAALAVVLVGLTVLTVLIAGSPAPGPAGDPEGSAGTWLRAWATQGPVLADDGFAAGLSRGGWDPSRITTPVSCVPEGCRADWLVSTPRLREGLATDPALGAAVAGSAPVAVFGSDEQRVEVRRTGVPPDQEAGEREARIAAGRALSGLPRLVTDPGTRELLDTGRTDPRVLAMIATLTARGELRVTDLPPVPGEDAADRPRRQMLLEPTGPAPGALAGFFAAQYDPYRPTAVVDTPDGLLVTYSPISPPRVLDAFVGP